LAKWKIKKKTRDRRGCDYEVEFVFFFFNEASNLCGNDVFFIKIFFKITEIFFRYFFNLFCLRKSWTLNYKYLFSMRGCVRCHHAVFFHGMGPWSPL
jgi:hypothetical protein